MRSLLHLEVEKRSEWEKTWTEVVNFFVLGNFWTDISVSDEVAVKLLWVSEGTLGKESRPKTFTNSVLHSHVNANGPWTFYTKTDRFVFFEIFHSFSMSFVTVDYYRLSECKHVFNHLSVNDLSFIHRLFSWFITITVCSKNIDVKYGWLKPTSTGVSRLSS